MFVVGVVMSSSGHCVSASIVVAIFYTKAQSQF